MQIKGKLFYLLTALLLLPAVCFGDKVDKLMNSEDIDWPDQLQESCAQFPILTPAMNDLGEPAFQTLKLNHPVTVDGIDFYGFRFKVSGRKAKEDFVWAFIQNGFCYWDILPQTGDTDFGFDYYYYESRNHYQGMEKLFPSKGYRLVKQCFSGNLLEDDKYYFIYFAYNINHKPLQMSLKFTFANLPPTRAGRIKALDSALGLHHK